MMISVASCSRALGIGLALALLGGCAAPVGKSSTVPAYAAYTSSGRPSMEHTSKGAELIYATGACGGACILSFPGGSLVGQANISGFVGGVCSDGNGNVFITNDTQVLEYLHGGTSPVATLTVPGNEAKACSLDPVTGNLAVVFTGSNANVAVFSGAQGTPTLYEAHIVSLYCGYDNMGNLFVSGYYSQQSQLAELPYGSSTFTVLSISPKAGIAGQVQWDGNYVTYESRKPNDIKISRLIISGSKATIAGSTHIKGALTNASQSWIYGNRVVIPYSIQGQRINKIALWPYPKSGKAVRKFGDFGQTKFAKFMGVTVSI